MCLVSTPKNKQLARQFSFLHYSSLLTGWVRTSNLGLNRSVQRPYQTVQFDLSEPPACSSTLLRSCSDQEYSAADSRNATSIR